MNQIVFIAYAIHDDTLNLASYVRNTLLSSSWQNSEGFWYVGAPYSINTLRFKEKNKQNCSSPSSSLRVFLSP